MKLDSTINPIMNQNGHGPPASDLTSTKNHIWNIKAFILLNILTILTGLFLLLDFTPIKILKYELSIENCVRNMFTILLACVIGSIIGWERENKNRPAGLRTYSLVCMGSALVMITSYQIFNDYHALGNFDPARLGAQVISGIGFLGAGTIIRDKYSVKGLTTAASLWVVACIGLTVGAQMYITSIMISAVVYYVLHNLRCMEDVKVEKMNYELILHLKEQLGQLKDVHQVLDQFNIGVRDINMTWGNNGILEEDNDHLTIIIHAMIVEEAIDDLILELNSIKGIISVYCSEI